MVISRLTVDKLGVKLYDSVSAVVAELIANGYDADGETVRVRLPLNTLLATKQGKKSAKDAGYVIEVLDDGHGMSPDEAIDHYLQCGRDRRMHAAQGPRSREKARPVMGRKGIGKLAPFGICRRIEVRSAGGKKTSQGYVVTHFTMDYDKILQDTDKPVQFDSGPDDSTFSPSRGTIIRLHIFQPKRVPDSTTFHRQLARRFAFARPDFKIIVEDTRDPKSNPPAPVRALSIPLLDGTKIDLQGRPVVTEDGETLAVTGWLGLAKKAYENEEMAGVRVYARDKIVASTRDFEQPAGYTGEFTMRSYLVGEVHAEWLDLDDGDDLIRTDRQGIVWDSDYGRALRKWGGALIKEIGAASRQPRRKRVRDLFLERSKIEDRARKRYADQEVVDTALQLAAQIGGFAAEDELQDEDYLDELSAVILAVAPHKALIDAFQRFAEQFDEGTATIDSMVALFGKTRVAEMASYSQIASERVRVIDEFKKIIKANQDESKLQKLLARAPWLIEPTWSVITKNQALKTFKDEFEHYWKQRTGNSVVLAIDHTDKRPDFTLVNVGHRLHIVEIKACAHVFSDDDFDRLLNYVDAFETFWAKNKEFEKEFSDGWRIDLIADDMKIKDSAKRRSFEALRKEGRIVRDSWIDVLTRARVANELFLDISEKAQKVRDRQTTAPSKGGAAKR